MKYKRYKISRTHVISDKGRFWAAIGCHFPVYKSRDSQLIYFKLAWGEFMSKDLEFHIKNVKNEKI